MPEAWLVKVVAMCLVVIASGLVVEVSRGGSRAPFPADGELVFAGVCGNCQVAEGLFTIRTDGTKVGFLSNGVGTSDPRWSPDGRWIAVALSYEIVLVRADDSGIRIVTHPPGLHDGNGDSEPSWSPDGKHLVFIRLSAKPTPNTGDYPTSIWRVGIDGRGAKQLLDSAPLPGLSGYPNVIYPELSPNGRRLAYGDNSARLWVAKADGSGRRRLGPASITGEEPRWSPDGRRVAFIDSDAGELRVLDVDSGQVRTLPGEDVLQYADAWSPDGRWIAEARSVPYDCTDPDGCADLELWIVNAFDGRAREIRRMPFGGIVGLDWRR
jgi:TolB protein